MFRLAALLLPVFLLGVCEAVLRLIGYGYSPHFFLPATINGQRVFIENDKFSRRYFPPALARTPQPVVFSAKKPPNTVRIFVFGESAAMGDPEPSFGLPRVLEVLLQERYPGKRFEVINVAVTAINSHVIREIAKDCASKEGDVWIIYMGNNEVVGPFGAGTVFGSQAPSLAFIRANIAFKATRVGQLLDSIRLRFGPKSATPASWEGMEMFLKQQIRQSDPRMDRVYSHFERNLRDIIEIGQKAGAHILLSTVVSNLKDCPPFASLHSPALQGEKLKEWESLYRDGIGLETKSNFVAALAFFDKAAALDDQYAELQFRRADCHAVLTNWARARELYTAARDLDTLRFRADSRENEMVHSAGKNSSLTFIDGRELITTNSPHTIPGEELLLEHVHFTFEGNYLLARAMADGLRSVIDHPAPAAKWLGSDECAARLAFTDWDRLQLIEELIERLRQPPFTQQLNNAQRIARWQKLRSNLQAIPQPELLAKTSETYRTALQHRPDDWILHENFAKLLQSHGDPPGAEKEWRKVVAMLPQSEQALYSLGNVLDAEGKSAEALTYFRKALRKRPDSYEARNGLGLALSGQGKTEEAIANYRDALRQKPDFTEARINLGQTLIQLGRDDEAIAEYRTALRFNSNNVAAHINLGRALAKQKKSAEARSEYEAALALDPANAIAHYNLGNLLANQNDPSALEHFEAAVRANPQFAEARYNLGLGFAAQNRTADAIAQFKEVVRLQPDFIDAHLNFGVALAKQGRFTEATSEFEAVLRLDPQNAAAKKYLEQARQLQGKGVP